MLSYNFFLSFKHTLIVQFSKLCAYPTISDHMEDIIGLVFKYLHLLKEDGIHEWIFDEVTDRHIV